MDGSFVPTGVSGWALLALAAGPPAAMWVVGAWIQACREEARREPRVAHRALRRLLDEIRRRGSPPTRADLECWRAGVARRCAVPEAAPDAREIATRATDEPAQQRRWQTLWTEAEAALYSPKAVLPTDWPARAGAALDALGRERRGLPWPRHRRHWLPLLAIGLFVLCSPPGAGAEDVFAGDKPALAAAQATAAFLRTPDDREQVARLRAALQQLEAPDPVLVRVFGGPVGEAWIANGSPAQWERVARGAALGAGAAFTLALGLAYAGRGRKAVRVAFVGGVLAGGVAAGGFVAVQRYGMLARPLVALVVAPVELRQQPSDIGGRPAVLKLAPGALVVVERTFLGWDRVAAGEARVSGWLRTENVRWLYRARESARASDPVLGW